MTLLLWVTLVWALGIPLLAVAASVLAPHLRQRSEHSVTAEVPRLRAMGHGVRMAARPARVSARRARCRTAGLGRGAGCS